MSEVLRAPASDALIAAALAEDLGVAPEELERSAGAGVLDRDVTGALIAPGTVFAGAVVAREPGVVCGLPVAARVWEMLAAAAGVSAAEAFPLVAEGAAVREGTAVMEVEGDARLVLAGERTALDVVMVLSGIATEAARWVAAAEGITVCDTRKTLPGMRALSKYAVVAGGGTNHRMGLYDMYLVKDNHVLAAGGITAAVTAARSALPDLQVEVEAETVEAAAEAASAGADIVLLDNMDDITLARAVAAVEDAVPAGGRCLTEASGGIGFDRLPALAAAGVDRVSASALTMARPLDFGLDEQG